LFSDANLAANQRASKQFPLFLVNMLRQRTIFATKERKALRFCRKHPEKPSKKQIFTPENPYQQNHLFNNYSKYSKTSKLPY
jgi:hypothetical protein